MWATWTPDKRIVFASYAGGNSILATQADGSGAMQLTPASESNVSYFRVSPNGRYVVFNSWKTGWPHLWRMDVDGTNLRQLTNGQYDYGTPDFSPDGAWWYTPKLVRKRESGRSPLMAVIRFD